MNFRPSLLSIAVASIVWQACAHAEESERTLAPVKTSAAQEQDVQTRTEIGRLNDYTPLAGTVVQREEVENLHFVDSLAELMLRVPGVSSSRNLRFTDGGKNYTENRIDGMRARNTGTYSFVDQMNSGDIERIEIIRGPGSVLSGSNAIGGTINVITRDPPPTGEQKFTQEIFGEGGYRSGVTGGGQISDSVGYFFNVNRLQTEGWRQHSAEVKDGASTKWVIRPDELTRIAIRYEYLHDDYEDPGTLTSQALFDKDWRQAVANSYYRTDVVYSTPSLHFRRLIGDSGELNIFAQSRLTDQTSKSSLTTGTITDTDTSENNIQLIYKQNIEFAKSSLTGGFDYLDTTNSSKAYKDLSPGNFDFVKGALTGESTSYEKSRSPFLQYEFSPLDALRVTYGLRADSTQVRTDNKLDDKKDGQRKYEKTVNKAGLVYELTPNTLLWANLAEGFLSPSISTLLGSTTTAPATHAAAVAQRYVLPNMDLRPETSLTKEIGVRGRNEAFKYDVGYYYTDFTDLIVPQLCGTGELCYTKNVNAAKAHAHGVESEVSYRLNELLEFALSHTYSKYAYDEYVTSTANYSGKERYWTPRNHYNARVVFSPLAQLRAELEYDRIDAYFTNGTNTDTYQRPDIVNLRVNYRHSKTLDTWFHALNLFDQHYAFKVGADDKTGVKNNFYTPYSPLTLRLGLSYKF